MTKALLMAALVMMSFVRGELIAMANGVSPVWYQGSLEAGFAEAKRDTKPILVYWGAVWCPSCNELKSQVFSQPRFAELMKPMIAIALDGDSEQAQAWGETLQVHSYPTVLLLSSTGKELMRLPTSVSMSEFETALSAALNDGQNFAAALKRGLDGKATLADWRMLAYYNWTGSAPALETTFDLLATQAKLLDRIAESQSSAHLVAERALLGANFLNSCLSAAPEERKKYYAVGRTQLNWLLDHSAAAQAARSTLAYNIEILGRLYPDNDKESQKMDQLWSKAAKQIAENPETSIDIRLWAQCEPLQLFRLRHKGAPITPALKLLVIDAVATADKSAKSGYERHSFVSGAASLLQDAGAVDAARKLLDRELLHTNTPWSYQSAYASLEKSAGRDAEALARIQKARESVIGRASKLQWITADLAMTASIKSPDQQERLLRLVREYYQEAMQLHDSFKGRNSKTAARVSEQLKPWLAQPQVREVVEQYAAKCKTADAPEGCSAHFAALGLPNGGDTAK